MRGLMFFLFKKVYRLLRNKGLEKVPGLTGAYDFLLQRLRPRGLTLAEIQGNKMYVNADYKWGGVMWLMSDSYEKWETELVKGIITEGMTVVDIGANIGYYTLIAAKLVGSSGKVYTFEPEPGNYKLLVKNIEVNGYTNVIPLQEAVSNKGGKARLFLDQVNSGNPSFSQHNVIEKGGWVEVETVTLSEFFKHEKVDFIKIDAQGAEGLIVDGAGEILKRDGLRIMMEFWPTGLNNLGTKSLELLYKLQEIGFKIKVIDKITRCLQPVEIMEIIELRKEEAGEGDAWISLLLEK